MTKNSWPEDVPRAGLLAFLVLLILSCTTTPERPDYIGTWQRQPGSLTYVNFDQHMKLTFPNEQWKVYTQPSDDLAWFVSTQDDFPYHVLIATIPELALVMQVLVQPVLDQEISLGDYLVVTGAATAQPMVSLVPEV